MNGATSGVAGRAGEIDLAVLGDCNPDVILSGRDVVPAFGQAEQLVEDMTLAIGGSAGIMAAGAARLGLRTALFAVVGRDAFADFMLQALGERGVDTHGCVANPTKRTGLTVVLSKTEDRAILTYTGTMEDLAVSRLDLARVLGARHIHVTSFFLQTRLAPEVPALFRRARAAGATTSIDPNWDPSGRWAGGIHEALAEANFFFPNEEEASRISGVEDVPAAGQALAAMGPAVVVKRGADGALVAFRDEVFAVGTPVSGVEVADTTGAGDSFDAGFLAGYIGGRSLEAAARLGCVCGSLSVRAIGGVDAQPTMEEAVGAEASGSAPSR
jgi:sugar/nucleoside kinase (ribokinase family)